MKKSPDQIEVGEIFQYEDPNGNTQKRTAKEPPRRLEFDGHFLGWMVLAEEGFGTTPIQLRGEVEIVD